MVKSLPTTQAAGDVNVKMLSECGGVTHYPKMYKEKSFKLQCSTIDRLGPEHFLLCYTASDLRKKIKTCWPCPTITDSRIRSDEQTSAVGGYNSPDDGVRVGRGEGWRMPGAEMMRTACLGNGYLRCHIVIRKL